MKFLQIFSKTPRHKRFSYEPRFYDPQAEDRKERENRIRKEVESQQKQKAEKENTEVVSGYRDRIAGSFRQAKKTAKVQSDPSAAVIRLAVLLILTLGLIGYLHWGKGALYVVALAFIPFYLFLKYRGIGAARSSKDE